MTASLEPIAIVGVACRFPGAEDPAQFWQLLLDGRDATGEVPADRWDRELLHDPDLRARGKVRTWRGGFLRQVDGCDWRALRLLPREARHMDPQHRLLLELAWEALEDSGVPFESVAGSRAGVFVGIQWNDFLRLLGRDWSRLDGYALLGNGLMMAANRVSYAFDLRGPSLALDSGCASGLVALKLACQSLWLGEADLALAGACELVLSPDGSIAAEAAGLVSRSGRCRPLHAAADGFLRGEGAGMLVLKPLSRLAPGERAYAVVRSVAVNHNGHNEWLMASSPRAQQQAIREACAGAGIAPAALDYVELHATGNPRGDVLEVKALGELLAAPGSGERSHPCLLGAVKGQLGHLGRAAGMAALIKTALALHHRLVPPMPAPAADEVHPGLPLASLGLALPARALPWPVAATAGTPTAGVSALSLGGGNAHAILQAAPRPLRPPRQAAATAPRVAGGRRRAGPWLLPLSARCPAALAELARRYARRLREFELAGGGGEGLDQAVDDFCWTAALGRSHHAHRAAVIGGTASELIRELEAVAAEPPRSPRANPGASGAPAARTGQAEPLESLAACYTAGGDVDWRAVSPADGGVTSLPGYPWQRVSMWPSWLDARAISTAPEAVAGGASPGAPAAPSPDAAADRRVPTGRALRQRLALAAPAERGRLLAGYLRGQLRRVLPGEASDLDARPLAELGLDSLTAHELSVRLEADLATVLPIAEIFGAGSLAELTDRLAERWRRGAPLPAAGPAARPAARGDQGDATEIEVFRL